MEGNVMREYQYKKTDAFTSQNSLGNPAASIYLTKDQVLTDSEMLSIAKQHKGFVSEMVYCTDLGQKEFKLSYYSSECEVDFCGHGTIACMYSLIKKSPELINEESIKIHTARKGTLTVFNKIKEQDAVYITAPQPTFMNNTIEQAEIISRLDLEATKLAENHTIEIINGGLTTLIVPIASVNDVISLYPQEEALKAFCLESGIDIILVFSTEVKNETNIAHTRVFAPKFGYLEDPATGSGNSAFGYYMQKNGMWDGSAVSIEQGGEGIIYNTVKLCTLEDRILFGGSATDRIVGNYLMI